MPIATPAGKVLECAAAKGLQVALMSVVISASVKMTNLPPSLGVKVGDPVDISFFALPMPVDRRSPDDPHFRFADGMGVYPICNETFSVSVGPVQATMGEYVAPVEYEVPAWMEESTFFAMTSKRPTYDSMFLTPTAAEPAPMPLLMHGLGDMYPEEWELQMKLVFERGTLPGITVPENAKKSYTAEKLVKSEMWLATTYFPSNTVLSFNLEKLTINENTNAFVKVPAVAAK